MMAHSITRSCDRRGPHMRTKAACFRGWGAMVLSLILATGSPVLLIAGEPGSPEPQVPADPTAGEVQERGITPLLLEKAPGGRKVLPTPPAPGGGPPPQLCHSEARMLTQCKCFNQAECQPLTALFPGSCPAGSQHCEFVPMSRGAMPPLPPNLCGYQVPFTVTKCSCNNAAECQLLSPFCPGSCPAGIQSCECTPMQRR
jgi:hypothetical protein